MAMSVAIAETVHTSCKRVTFVWVSASDGTASGTTTAVFDGMLAGLATTPAGGGSAPTDNYDVVINDASGNDVLLGAGANRSSSLTQYVTGASLAGVSGQTLTIGISNAGSGKGGTVVIWLR